MTARRFRTLAGLCFFATGATSLVYQVVWSRYLTLIFGAAHYSVATVVAAYMLGLGLGAWLLGRVADRSANPARLYALLELAVAAYGALSPWLFRLVEKGYVAFVVAADPGPALATAIKLLLALVALALPTLLMGGTLPVLGRALVGAEPGSVASDVGSLYAWNTLGAVSGATIAGFVLVERLGLARSLFLAAGVNALAALVVLAARPGAPPLPPLGERPPLRDLLSGLATRFALMAAFVAGFASLADEIVWTRVLALLTGSSTWAFTVILSTFLLGIGLGAAWSARHAAPSPALRLAGAQVLAAAGASLLLVLYEPAARLILASGQNPLTGQVGLFALRALIAAFAVVPATIGFGASFPALVALAAGDGRRAGSQVGLIYAFNTAGAILGSLAGGFLLLNWFSSYGVLRAGVLASLALAVVAVALARHRGEASGARMLAPLAGVALVATLVLLHAPWPAHLLDLGPAVYLRAPIASRIDLDAFIARGKNQVLWLREGPVATVTVRDSGHSRYLRVNGKTDASTSADMGTQIAVGLLPVARHPRPRRTLLIGAGSGVTARVMAEAPGVERLDLVEIEPAVIESGRFFEDVNGGVYRRPGVEVHLEDGRNHLLTATGQWDVIVSEPSNPWMSGIANLFTREYYALVRKRLAPGGVFCQWLQRYDMTEGTFRRLVATLLESFPHVELWRGGRGDSLLLAFAEPLPLERARAEAVIAAARAAHPGELEGFLELESADDLPALYVLGGAGLKRFAGDARGFGDDPPELEFAAFRELRIDTRWTSRTNLALIEIKRELRDGAPPATPEWTPPERAYGMGRLLLGFQEAGPAAMLLEQSLAMAPRPRVWRWLGEARLQAGDAAGAEQAWGQALSADPSEQLASVRLARIALVRGDIASARIFAPGRERAPGLHEAALLDAELALAEGRPEDALPALRAAWDLHRFVLDPPELLNRVHSLYAAASAPGAALDETIAELRARIEAEPAQTDWRVLLAQILERAGRCPEVVAELEWLEAHGARSVETLLRKGQCLQAMGRRDDALAAWREAARHEPWRVDLSELGAAAALPR